MEEIVLCRVCLNANVRHLIKNTPLEEVYEKLTGMPTNDMRPLSVCNMCYAQLLKTHKFKLTCLRAEDLLTEMMTQLVNTEQEVDEKATLIDQLRLSSALSVSPIVTTSTTDYDKIDSEVEEISDEQDFDMEDEYPPESPDITIGPTMIGFEEMLDEQERSLDVICKSEETYYTHDTAAAAGNQHEDVQLLDNHALDAPVANQHELVSHQAPNCVKDLKCKDITSDTGKVEASVFDLSNEENTSTIITIVSESDEDDDSDDNTSNSNPSNNNDFSIKSNFGKNNEIKTNHSEMLNYDVCQKSISNKSNFTNHVEDVMVHTGDESFTCYVCEKTFKLKSSFTRHIKFHVVEKPFACNVCDKRFYQKSHLREHTLIHTGDKPFTCNLCDKAFVRKSYLNSHIRIHSNDRPYTCHMCYKRFTTKSRLNSHTRIHDDDKPFTCNVCRISFRRQYLLIQHSRVHDK